MKTAIKYPLVVLIALGTLASVSARAQSSAVPGPGSVALPGGLSAQPTSPIPTAAAPVSLAPATPARAAMPSSAASSKDGSAIPSSVQNVLDKMKEDSQDVTLGELNTAREAIAKLDMMIDIEKRLSDLATIRKEREEKSMTAVAAALPPAAYTPPPALPSASAPVLGGAPSDYGLPDPTKFGSSIGGGSIGGGVKHTVSEAGPNKVDIQRIIGAEGRYIAYIKGDDGRDAPYHQGDKLSDGSLITSISRNGVTLSKNKKTSTFQVKDIAKVFGAR